MTDIHHWERLECMPRAFGPAPMTGRLRAQAEHFKVDEVLGFEPSGSGEHALLLIQKSGLNTDDIARRLARHAGCRPMDVGYCGLKDRHAVTTQWFSVALGGRVEPDWSELNAEAVTVLQIHRHQKKLRRGIAKGNRFRIRITDIQGDVAAVEERLVRVHKEGSPNYFGEQRFGRDYGNLAMADQLFERKLKRVRPHQKGLYLSAARSQIFNQYLSQRVSDGTWNRALSGDVLQLDGSRAWFAVAELDADIERRIQEHDVHPTGPLWGAGELPTAGSVASEEQVLGERFEGWCRGLEQFGLKQERRALRMDLHELSWEWQQEALMISFRLPSGYFATSALRELADLA